MTSASDTTRSPAPATGEGGAVRTSGIRNVNYRPPFVWFGGKSAVANLVWDAFGDVDCYVEPFAGSAAVLFLRPGGPGKVETINDADGFISNVWRAIRADPGGVADYADEIVSECELHSRHLWLVGKRESLTDRLCGDVDFYDVKAAGYWLYGINCWIGSGWCSGRGPWIAEDGRMILRNTGQGVSRKLPHLGDTGQGVNRQLPRLGDTGKGVNRQLPRLGDTGKGDEPAMPTDRRIWLRSYLKEFAGRLGRVRVCCGDWSRVCGPSVTFKHGVTGVFLDPPYADTATRTSGLYAVDCEQVAHAVREWAIEQGRNPLMRIALAGYQDEHAMPDDWRVEEWTAAGGYALQSDEGSDSRSNSGRERIWFSPACLNPAKELSLFGRTA